MLKKGLLVAPNNNPGHLCAVTQAEEVIDGRFIVTCKRIGVLDAPEERYWDDVLHEVKIEDIQPLRDYTLTYKRS
jgi:hypothetical protein